MEIERNGCGDVDVCVMLTLICRLTGAVVLLASSAGSYMNGKKKAYS